MDPVTDEDITPGFCPYLLPEILADDPRTVTNAKMAGGVDYAVTGGHPFIILGQKNGLWHAVPVFSIEENEGSDRDRHALILNLKTGAALGWTDKDSYIFKWQHWLIPTSALIDASIDDTSNQGDRRFYDSADGGDLQKIVGYLSRAREPFRAPIYLNSN